MKFFAKILFLLLILVILGAFIAYPFYRAPLQEKARVFISEEISKELGCEVTISSINYLPFSMLSLKKVEIDKGSGTSGNIKIDTLTINIDIASLLKNKQLFSTIKAEGINIGKTSCDVLLRTTSHPANTYREALSASLIDSVFIIESDILSGNIHIDNLIGTLKIENMGIISGDLSLKYNNNNYLVEFTPYFQLRNSYNISIRSKDLSLISTVSYDSKRLLVKKLTGSFYTFDFDVEGRIDNFISGERTYSMKGVISADLETFDSKYDRIDGLDIKVPIAGTAKLKFEAEAKALELKKIKATALMYIEYIDIGKFHIDSISSKIYLDNGILTTPETAGYLYTGNFSANATIDITKNTLPYTFILNISDISLDALLKDLEYRKRDIYGYCFSDLSLNGNLMSPGSYEGYLNMKIKDGNLGPMPVLTPLLGNLFSLVRKQLIPDNDKVNINQAYGTFAIKDRKLSTDDAMLWGNNIAIKGKGYMDFNGTIDFTLQNEFTQTPVEEIENWQTAFRNSIIRLGKAMGKARLKGTVMAPKWEFDYFPKD